MTEAGGAATSVLNEPVADNCESKSHTRLPVLFSERGTYLDLPGVRFGDGTIDIEPGIPFADWQALIRFLLTTEKNIRWWIGDTIRYGERQYGEDAYQAMATATGYQEDSIKNFAWVAGAIPPSRRRENVKHSHHAVVASLRPAEQLQLLERAEKEKLTVRTLERLRDDIKASRGERPAFSEAACEHEFQCRRCGEARP